MPSPVHWVVSHWVGSPVRHIQQAPQAIWNGTTTRSPADRSGTPAPTFSTMPMGSWPRMSPGVMNGVSTSYRCRSEPHSPVDVIRMTASVGSWITGSGTVSTRTSRLPCHVTAFIAPTLRSLASPAGSARVPGAPPPNHSETIEYGHLCTFKRTLEGTMNEMTTAHRKLRARRARHRSSAGPLLAALTAAALLAGCTVTGTDGDGRGRDDGRRDGQVSAPPVGSVLAVKIDNVSAARPQTGLDAADIVYAEQVEGGLSRLMAVFATEFPETVGPVRSARESDLELLRQFHEPTLAFSGAQGKLLPLIDRAPLRAETPEDAEDAYFRGDEKPIPHNLYLRPDELIDSPPGADALTTGFRFGPAPAGGAPRTPARSAIRRPASPSPGPTTAAAGRSPWTAPRRSPPTTPESPRPRWSSST